MNDLLSIIVYFLASIKYNFISYMPKKSKINTVVILAGGLGTRLSEETKKKPKPMVMRQFQQ